MKMKLDRFAGPLTSLLLNGLIIFALYKFVTFATKNTNDSIDVMMMEIEDVDLDEFKEKLEDLQDLENVVSSDVITDVQIDTETPEVTENVESTDDFSTLDVMNDFSSPVIMKGLLASRTSGGRAASLRKYAGRHAAATEKAVLKALEWLRINQKTNGSFPTPNQDTAMAAFGLMTFLAHGETPSSEKYGKTVERAIRHILDAQDPTGWFKGGNSYVHAIATYAISEAYAMTRIPSLKPAMDKGVQRIVDGIVIRQVKKRGSMTPVKGLDANKMMVSAGQFDYRYQAARKRWDTSVTGWHAQALKAAKLAGCKNPKIDQTLTLISNSLKTMQDSNGRIAYAWEDQPAPGGGTVTMAAVGCLCLQLMGEGKCGEVNQALSALSELHIDPKDRSQFGAFYYRNYYVTQAKFHAGKGTWSRWNKRFAPVFTALQNDDGSWGSPGADAEEKVNHIEEKRGKAYPTTLAALSLMVYYRNLPTFQERAVQKNVVEDIEDNEDVELEIL